MPDLNYLAIAIAAVAVHAGDWLLKLLVIAVIVTLWR